MHCFLFDLFLQKRLPILFELLTWHQKMTFWHPFWRFFVRTSVGSLLCRHPRFRPVLLLLQTTQAQEKSCQAVVRSAVRCQLNSDQFLVPSRVECGGGRVLNRAMQILIFDCWSNMMFYARPRQARPHRERPWSTCPRRAHTCWKSRAHPVVHAHTTQCMFYTRINSGMPAVTVGPKPILQRCANDY